MGVMSLGVVQGADVTLKTDGDDEEAAMATIVEAMETEGLAE
ncbi:MAG: HPr family phosphocarrier protein, partial [Leuconostoc gelidum]